MSGLFVTGTDTGVGKTLVATQLMRELAARGERVAGYKPVASGCRRMDGELVNDDALALLAASNVQLSYPEVNPVALEPAVAPHLAAARAGVALELAALLAGARALAARADRVVVEGAGGWRVPLDGEHDLADLAVALGHPVVLVVGMRLGCINHAVLTVEAVLGRGLPLAGWVANHIDPALAEPDGNLETLRARLPAPLLGVIPWSGAQPTALPLGTLDLQTLS